ncbi:MAG TPA: putative DNA binding domain-containing protein, partial [bacterium]|nr:putative DNA binding domain-containing protein [bacterium]
MRTEELKRLLSLGENEKVEFKRQYNSDSAGREICAFLNSKGGFLICGVEDDKGTVAGVNLNLSKVENELAEHIIPKAPFFFELHDVEGKKVLVIEVPAGKDIPYSFNNDIFIRVRDKTKKADIETIREMVFRRQNEPERWERRFSDAQIDQDVDYDHLQSIGNKIKKSGRYSFAVNKNKETILESLSLEKFGRLTNAGDVLLCTNTANRYPQVIVKAASFPTGKTSDEFRDFKNFDGPLLKVLEEVYNFILRNTSTRSYFIKDSLERKDEPVYPMGAVREGLINAFVHRDYSDYQGSLSVFIYPDRLEISNSGEFPKGITADKIGYGQISVLRNPDIANMVYICGMMEKVGRGGLFIRESCKEKGLPEPLWTNKKDLGVTLTLF